MTNQLIPVFNGTISNEPVLLCNARDLHTFLEVGKNFSNWIVDRISEYEFVANLDYIVFTPNLVKTPGRPKRDYHLTLDTAKELAMVERNEKGRQIRRYFIECEKQLHQQPATPKPPKRHAVIIYYENDIPVDKRPLQKDEHIMTVEDCREIMERAGNLVIHYRTLRDLTCEDFVALANRAEHCCLEWQKKMALV